jgi:PhzF family phenazine biosynthesis protein
MNTATEGPDRVTFAFVDVFAERPLTGNPLAVVPDADPLAESTMRRIAREFNQSETTFLVRPEHPRADRRLRSFTPIGAEVTGAGHNALGAWLWLAQSGRLGDDPVRSWTQEIAGQVLPVEVRRSTGTPPLVTMEQSPLVLGPVVADRTALAEAIGLSTEDLADDLPAQVASTGATHLLVPVTTRAAVDRIAIDSRALAGVLRTVGGEGCYLYSVEPGPDGADAYARFVNPTMGIPEDPATGTAAGPLAGVLVRCGVVAGDTVRIRQGQAIGRPSVLHITVRGDRVWLSGSGVVVASGELIV